jgi:hypothetical protein
MLGLIYIALCIGLGWVICSFAFPKLADLVKIDYYKRRLELSPYMLLFPAWLITGILALTWTCYILAYMFKGMQEPLVYANLLAMPTAVIVIILAAAKKMYKLKAHKLSKTKDMLNLNGIFCNNKKVLLAEFALITAIVSLAVILMRTTFFVRGNSLYVGLSVFSDFSPHIGMIRSFSYGNNFPTTYSHYAGEDIKYHFMFHFLAGNLEFLGMRIDYAFNLPSILCLLAAFMLLYVLAVRISGKIGVGVLACMFFAFRSAKTLYTFISRLDAGTGILKTLKENREFISDTPNENWGLWNLNVYCNQRHFALGLAVMFFILILFLEHAFDMFMRLKQDNQADNNSGYKRTLKDKLWNKLKLLFFSVEGWSVRDVKGCIAAGIILGSLGFFHGAALIGCLLVLFVVAIVSSRRLEFLIAAVITVALSYAQTTFFINGSVVSPQLFFGFIAENKTFFGVLSYLERLLGVLPLVLLLAFCIENGINRWLLLAFGAPLIFAFTVSLTVDVTVNHKYIMMSCILLGIFAASVVKLLLEHKRYAFKAMGLLLILMLTSTGIYDFYTVIMRNSPESAIILELDDPLTEWIKNNSDSQDIYLTHIYALNQVVLGGAMLYEGWPYFPWSAGYDTIKRDIQVTEMYEADTPEELDRLVARNNIRFIIVARDNRESDYYTVNEENIIKTYECVYTEGEGYDRLSIYDTQKPIYR